MNDVEISSIIISVLEKKELLPGDTTEEKLAYRYLDTGHIDSFSILNLIVEIENAFDITLSPEDTQSDEFRTPGGLVSLIKGKIVS